MKGKQLLTTRSIDDWLAEYVMRWGAGQLFEQGYMAGEQAFWVRFYHSQGLRGEKAPGNYGGGWGLLKDRYREKMGEGDGEI